MHARRLRRIIAAFVSWVTLSVVAGAAEIDLTAPGTVILLRHAHAPGTGDPADFDLADCRTQRNLNAEGRAQARTLGRQLRATGLGSSTTVYTSPWCRCRETARLLDLAAPAVLDALGSFFARPGETDRIMTDLREYLRTLPVKTPPIVMVTHQVTISALTGEFMSSGEGIVLQLNGTAHPAVVGRLAFPSDGEVKNP